MSVAHASSSEGRLDDAPRRPRFVGPNHPGGLGPMSLSRRLHHRRGRPAPRGDRADDPVPFLTLASGTSRAVGRRGCSSLGGRRTRRSAPSCSPSSTRTRRRDARPATTSRATPTTTHELVPQWMRDWQATLFDHGWMIPGYPPELGGRNCTPVQTLIYLETLASRRILRVGPLPRLRDRRAEPARVRQRRAEARWRPPRSAATRSGASA